VRRASSLPIATIVTLPIVYFTPFLGGGRVIPFGDDMLLLNYPLFTLLAHALHQGYLPLWNPYSGGGYGLAPFSALPFYPVTWLLALLPVTAAMSWTYVLDFVIGGAGAYLLAGRVGVAGIARLVPAVVFPFSGFIMAHLYAGHILEVGVICWLPATLAALHWATEARTVNATIRRGLICGGPLGMTILANGVSWLVFVDYPVAIVGLALAGRAAWRNGGAGRVAMARAAARPALALAVAVAVAALLGGVVLLPLRTLLGATVRGGAMNYHAVARISEPPLGLTMALAPGLFGSDATHSYWFPNPDAYFQEVYAYIGLLPLALAILGVVVGWRRPNVPHYAALTVVGVVLALGSNTPLYEAVYRVVPGLDLARVPARWLLLSTVGVTILAGVGADALAGAARRGAPDERGRRFGRSTSLRLASMPTALSMLVVLLALVALALLGAGLAAMLPHASRHGATILSALGRLGLMALLAAAAALVAAQLPRSAGVALLAAVTLADLWTAHGVLLRPLDPAPYYRNAAVELAQRAADGGRVWALDRSIPLRVGMLDAGIYDVQDFAPLTLSDYWLFTHPGQSLSGVDTGMARSIIGRYNARIAVMLGVSLVIAPRPLHERGLVPLATVRVPRWGLLDGNWSHPGPHPGLAYAYRVAAPLPFALPVYSAHSVPASEALNAAFAPGFDPRRVVLLDSDDSTQPEARAAPIIEAVLQWWHDVVAPPAPCTARATSCRWASSSGGRRAGPGTTVVAYAENGFRLRVALPRAGLLLLDEPYDPGWTATADGRAVPLHRADYLLMALPLGAGKHTVTLAYAPSSYLAGAALTAGGYALVFGMALAGLAARAMSANRVRVSDRSPLGCSGPPAVTKD